MNSFKIYNTSKNQIKIKNNEIIRYKSDSSLTENKGEKNDNSKEKLFENKNLKNYKSDDNIAVISNIDLFKTSIKEKYDSTLTVPNLPKFPARKYIKDKQKKKNTETNKKKKIMKPLLNLIKQTKTKDISNNTNIGANLIYSLSEINKELANKFIKNLKYDKYSTANSRDILNENFVKKEDRKKINDFLNNNILTEGILAHEYDGLKKIKDNKIKRIALIERIFIENNQNVKLYNKLPNSEINSHQLNNINKHNRAALSNDICNYKGADMLNNQPKKLYKLKYKLPAIKSNLSYSLNGESFLINKLPYFQINSTLHLPSFFEDNKLISDVAKNDFKCVRFGNYRNYKNYDISKIK